jgi:tricorn protease
MASPQQGYYRAPALHQDQLVFTAEGDLWLQQLGSTKPAQRLTTHPAEEINAQWSKDGQWLAYQANYEGVSEVYVLSKDGGLPKRVSFDNSRVKVQGWTADGKVLYSTDHQVGPANRWLLKMVDPLTLATETLPLADAVEGVIDAKGEYLYFIRYGLQLTGDNARVYRGGAMGQLWRYHLGRKSEAIRLAADHVGSVRQVQLWRDSILLVSDASGNPNLWQFALDGSAGKAMTAEQDFQLRSFRVDGDNAVFQLGADLYQLALNATPSAKPEKLQLTLRSDAPYQRQRFIDKPLTYLTSASLAAKADKAVVTLRGKLAVLSKPPLRTVTIATPDHSRSRSAVLSPDGKFVYAINDQSGENEIWRFQADGSAAAKQLTNDGVTFRWGLYPSPDGRYLAHDDKAGNLWLLDVTAGTNQLIYQDGSGLSPYPQVVWSGDSQQLAFTFEHKDRERPQLMLYQLQSKQSQLLTSENYSSFSPAFSPDGHWLYFLSQRQFEANPASPWGDRNMGPAFDKRTQVYAIALTQGAKQPFLAPTELTGEPTAKPHIEANKSDQVASKSDKRTPLPLNQLPGQLYPIPVAAGNYQKLELNDKFLFLLDSAQGANTGTLKTVAIDALKPEMTTFSEQVVDFSLKHDGKQLLLSKKPTPDQTDLLLLDAAAKAPESLHGKALATKDLSIALQPAAEWQQMFNDAWIMHRDSLFDPNTRGVDWQASKQRYQPLLSRVRDRYELDDLFSQMMGELDALHSQVRGNDFAKPQEPVLQATLGAELSFADNAVWIKQIYRTDADLPLLAAPLAKAGVDAKAGDQIMAINGQTVTDVASYHQALLQQQNKQVLLTLKRQGKVLQTVAEAISPQQETMLRYSHWVQSNQQHVASLSKQQLGYLHLNAMTPPDLAGFARDFYSQLEKPGLIIDVRRNRGGNIDSILIEKLLRRAWAFWQPVRGKAYPNMQQSFNGKLVVLTDELTYSDGETFAAGIKTLGLGTLIGKQTAGAGVWLSGRNLLSDYGVARVAETAQHAMDGRWLIEGRGVSPDLVVENLPWATFNGHDAQLAAAISYLQQQLKQHPPVKMQALPLPLGSAADATGPTTIK